MLVSVPDGARPGTQLAVTTPSGDRLLVQCPDGAVPGQQMQVDLPDPAAAPPVVIMADAVPVAAPSPAPILVAASVGPSDPGQALLGGEKLEQISEPSSSIYPTVPPQAPGIMPTPAPEPAPAPSPMMVDPNELYSWLQANRLEQYAAFPSPYFPRLIEDNFYPCIGKP
eukprot:COSAG02_NODE_147_length_33939_cov_6.689539_15_plen_169_part_00